MSVRSIILQDTYRDSVYLMKLSGDARAESGAQQISAMMGTERNKELFQNSGLFTPEIGEASPGDLVIAVEADDADMDKALEIVQHLLTTTAKAAPKKDGAKTPTCLEEALAEDADSSMLLVSTAGDYARYEAAKALAAGLDVMLYSDNISCEDEIALKTFARSQGRLVMGPDCGTAIVDGVPLAFANRVRSGCVGLVGASGTGLQELFCLLDRCGVGITNAYGTGGRDLKDIIGGITALSAFDRLIADPQTTILGLIGKPPGAKVRQLIADKIKASGKPAFVHYLGCKEYGVEEAAGMTCAATTTDLAVCIAKAVNSDVDTCSLFAERPLPCSQPAGFLRGLFGGGTLCQEAAELAEPYLAGEKCINMSVEGYTSIDASEASRGHTFWDLGDDAFTVGRPHPMIAPELRMDRLVQELCDPAVSVVLIDLVIGYGSHENGAGEVVKAIKLAEEQSADAAKTLVVASVCGTEQDNPSRSAQLAILEQAGVIVLPSNASAAVWAAKAAAGTTSCKA